MNNDYEPITINFGDVKFMDDDNYPLFEQVTLTEQDLIEENLRKTYPELQKAYDNYQLLLEKYGFWEKITK